MALTRFLRATAAASPLFSPTMTAQERQQSRQGSGPCREIGFSRSIEHLLFAVCAHESVAKDRPLRLHLGLPWSCIDFWPSLGCSFSAPQ